eukprot:gnl/MRDRNA2_/MRDRNA2_77353_c0_seq2.p1 gnl/MRDRNA2_/MRDRNA2_77353_c0~~gnl/MRDRNA2_/MRDRNA2_77353_c0_seq2.p1  ORF type:complete len:337 (-),score=88.94 gnl/MRDRNA2_/MRDRNA2_77353_c0_seq2:25-1035(-)
MVTEVVKRKPPVFGIADDGRPVIEPGPALSTEAAARRKATGTHVIYPPSGNPEGQMQMQQGMPQQGMMQQGMMQQGMMQRPPQAPPVPTCYAIPQEMYIGVLKNIVPSGLSGFIVCERSQKEYQKDVYIHKNVMDVSRVGLGDQLAFKLHISQKTGIPQCSAPCWKLVGDTGTGQQPHFGPYTGLVHRVEGSTGYIQSQQVLQKFGTEAQIHGSVLSTCGIELHDTLAFDIHLGEGGQPQVTAPLWLVKKAAAAEAAGAGASLYQPKKPFIPPAPAPAPPGFSGGLAGVQQPGMIAASPPAPPEASLSPALLDMGSSQLKQQQLQAPASKAAGAYM